MSNLEIITSLCSMLSEAQKIIRIQSEMLSAHGIETYDGALALPLRTARNLSTRLPPPLLFPSLTECYR